MTKRGVYNPKEKRCVKAPKGDQETSWQPSIPSWRVWKWEQSSFPFTFGRVLFMKHSFPRVILLVCCSILVCRRRCRIVRVAFGQNIVKKGLCSRSSRCAVSLSDAHHRIFDQQSHFICHSAPLFVSYAFEWLLSISKPHWPMECTLLADNDVTKASASTSSEPWHPNLKSSFAQTSSHWNQFIEG